MRNTILIVDDIDLNREILLGMLEDKFDCLEATNGKEALELIEQYHDRISAMLLDVQMPVMSGLECLEEMKRKDMLSAFPILVISGDTESKTEEECLNYGAFDFIKKPYNPMIVNKRIYNAISLFNYRDHLEEIVEKQTQKIRKQSDKLQDKNKQLREINQKTIELLSEVCEARSMECGTHIKRVKSYTNILIKELSKKYNEYHLSDGQIEKITNASAMHDIGKIAIPDSVLLKPGRLTPEEFEEMKTHTTKGVDILNSWKGLWENDYYRYCAEICKYHHEKWDGRGYPCGLKGDEIPIHAQVVAIADCFDALTTDRVYKKAIPVDEAYQMILNGECGQFNPKVIECLTKVLDRFKRIYQETNE